MDVIYHRNCMDGAYSAYLLYLFCKTITKKGYQLFLSHLLSHTNPNLQQYLSEQTTLTQQQIITQQFFHSPCQINFHAVSMYAGDLFPIFPSSKDNILIMVDISPSTKDMMELLASRFKIVVIFDHHTTFAKMVQFVKQAGIKNVLYLWDQVKCAAQIVLDFFFRGFGFPKNFSAQFRYELQEQINYVASNDLKINQSPMSKQFTLGFYYFEIQLSHQNPLLFKRLWQLKLETIFEKGKNAYKGHLEMLKKEVQHCQVWKLQKCKFKNETFLASQSNDKGLTSDLGSILAHLSVMLKYSNLGMIYKKGHNQCRISFRSQKSLKQQPMALKISQFFGGGGHVHAAGCFLSKGTFGQHFHLVGPPKPCIKIDTKEIEQILFMKDIQPESS